jgi:two-component system OmpR family response regulator
VVDDEANIREVVQYALEREGFTVELAGNGADALEVLGRSDRGAVDLVILDVLMPELDGLSLCRRLREDGADIPIIFLSSRAEEADRVVGLDLGGDDYVSKPFSPRELAARVRAVMRRRAGPAIAARPVLRHGRLQVDRDRHAVTVDDVHAVILTVTEIRLLAALIEHPGRVLSRGQLIDCAYDGEHHITERTIDTHIRNVRAKLASHGVDAIETVHGLGYRAR